MKNLLLVIILILILGASISYAGQSTNLRDMANWYNNYWNPVPAIHFMPGDEDNQRQARTRLLWAVPAGPMGAEQPIAWPPNFGGYRSQWRE